MKIIFTYDILVTDTDDCETLSVVGCCSKYPSSF